MSRPVKVSHRLQEHYTSSKCNLLQLLDNVLTRFSAATVSTRFAFSKSCWPRRLVLRGSCELMAVPCLRVCRPPIPIPIPGKTPGAEGLNGSSLCQFPVFRCQRDTVVEAILCHARRTNRRVCLLNATSNATMMTAREMAPMYVNI